MSYFAVAVFMSDEKQSLDDLLAPYDKAAMIETTDDGDIYNPDAKWNFYEIGGHWQGMLTLKAKKIGIRGSAYSKDVSDGYDGAIVRDIDFDATRKRALAELQPYKKAMKNSYMKESYMRKRFPTEKEYIERNGNFYTYAVITPDGVWHAAGEMGLFGLSSASPEEERAWHRDYYNRFIKPAIEKNWYMVIVDCHI